MSLNTINLPEFEILQPVECSENREAYRARWSAMNQDVRLIVLPRALSEEQEFRAHFRQQRPILESLSHPSVPQFFGWGEVDGQLYYYTEDTDSPSLNELLSAERKFTWDEIADIGWQIASVLQHIHNAGVYHGQLNFDSVLISDGLRVSVTQLGESFRTELNNDTDHWIQQVKRDLTDLGNILGTLADHAIPTDIAEVASIEPIVRQLITDLQSDSSANFPESARSVQARLGSQLISTSGDSIELVDQREGMSHSGRSIVDELFDDLPTKEIQAQSSADAAKLQIVQIVVIAAVAIVILAFLVYVFQM